MRIHRLGSTADGSLGHRRHRTDADALLPSPHGESQPADSVLQPHPLAIPVASHQRQADTLLAYCRCTVHLVPHRRSVPELCRGHLVFGIMFAATVYTPY